MKVRCTRLLDWRGETVDRSAWLKIGGIYHVLAIEMNAGRAMFRIIGEDPTPALFQPQMFEVVSSAIPESWVISSPAAGHFDLGPEAWARPGFWEDYFDSKP